MPTKDERTENPVPTTDEAVPQVLHDRSFIARARAVVNAASLRHALREIAIVTIGILIAFALNAWWENHKERRQEQQNLRALAGDFERNTAQLDELSKAEDNIATSSLELLKIARSGEDKPVSEIRD